MIIKIQNSSDNIYWLPFYTLNDKMHQSPSFPVLLIIQLSIFLSTAYVIIRTCSIFLSIKVFHENMNILMAWFLFQWFEAILAKLVIIPYQLGLILISDKEKTIFNWWTDNDKEMAHITEPDIPLLVASYLLWHYMYSMIVAILAIGLERVFATIYIQDYESVPRRHIPILLILITNLITIPYSYLVITNRISFLITLLISFIIATVVCSGYFTLFRVNLILRNRMAKRNDNDKYCLARKFQVEENIRSLILARKLVIMAVFYLSVTLTILLSMVFGVLEGAILVYMLDNSIFAAPLVLGTTLLFCSPAWKQAFTSHLPLIRNYRNPRVTQLSYVSKEKQESDVYFQQLKLAWE